MLYNYWPLDAKNAYGVIVGMSHFVGQKHKLKRKSAAARKSSTPYLKFLDRLTFVAGVIGPFTVFPQIWKIFATHSAAGVSLTTWVLILIVKLPWIFYGFAHKDKSIIVSFILWEIADLAVVVGILMCS